MEKFIIKILFTLSILVSSPSFGQTFSESDIKKMSEEINNQIKGVDFGNGVKGKGCYSFGRTLFYLYYVDESWQASENLKEILISNIKKAGTGNTYFLQNIDINYYYFKGDALAKKVSILSSQLSTTDIQLGELIKIKDHPKAKNVNLELKAPLGWEVKEGDRPNVVKKFVKDANTYLILIKENVTYFSKKQSKEMLKDKNVINELVSESCSFLINPTVLNQSVETVDNYPSVEFKVKGNIERTGKKISVIMKCWVVFYEDKIIILQSMGLDNLEYKSLDQLYSLITNSVVFPDQYN